MFSKEQAKEWNQNFWGTFHKRMRRHKSSNGRSISWLNYPSDVKGIFVRMVVDKKHASLNYDLQFKDDSVREIVWEQLTELKVVLENTVEYPTNWIELAFTKDGLPYSRISWVLEDVNYYKEEDHEKIYAFLEERLVKFDRFYQEFKEILVNLVH